MSTCGAAVRESLVVEKRWAGETLKMVLDGALLLSCFYNETVTGTPVKGSKYQFTICNGVLLEE